MRIRALVAELSVPVRREMQHLRVCVLKEGKSIVVVFVLFVIAIQVIPTQLDYVRITDGPSEGQNLVVRRARTLIERALFIFKR